MPVSTHLSKRRDFHSINSFLLYHIKALGVTLLSDMPPSMLLKQRSVQVSETKLIYLAQSGRSPGRGDVFFWFNFNPRRYLEKNSFLKVKIMKKKTKKQWNRTQWDRESPPSFCLQLIGRIIHILSKRDKKTEGWVRCKFPLFFVDTVLIWSQDRWCTLTSTLIANRLLL